MLHMPLTNSHLLAAKQKPYQKAYLLTTFFFNSGKSQENGPVDRRRKKDKTERAMGVSKKNKTGDRKVESNDSPEIQDRGEISHTSLVSVQGCVRILTAGSDISRG